MTFRNNQHQQYTFNDLPQLVADNNLVALQQVIDTTARKYKLKSYLWGNEERSVIGKSIQIAINNNKKDVLSLFLKNEFYIDESISVTVDGIRKSHRMIELAVKANNMEMTRFLIENNSLIKKDKRCYGNDDAIRAAVILGNTEMVDYLLQNGANAGALICEPENEYILAHAARNNRKDIVRLLIKYGTVKDIERALEKVHARYYRYASYMREALNGKYNETNRQHHSNTRREYLNKFDEERQRTIEQLEKLRSEYSTIFLSLMDYAVGANLDITLNEMESMTSVADMNFIGVLFKGHIITRDSLIECSMTGADTALVELSNLQRLPEDRKQLIQEQIEVNVKKQGRLERDGVINMLPLWRAAEVGDLEVVQTRLASGVNPNEMSTPKRNRNYPIVFAAKNNQRMIAVTLCQHGDFDVTTLPMAIIEAKKSGHIDLARELEALQDVNQLDKDGLSLLHRAVEQGDVIEVKRLIAKGANVNLPSTNGIVPLAIAAMKSTSEHLEILKILLANRADPDLFTRYTHETAMQLAGRLGNIEAFKILLPITQKTPIVKEIYSPQKTKVQLPWYSNILFELDMEHDHVLSIYLCLLKEGVDFNHPDERGVYLIHRLAKNFRSASSYDTFDTTDKMLFARLYQILEILIDNNANVLLLDSKGYSFLYYICLKNLSGIFPGSYARVIDKLIAKGVDITAAITADGKTPLHIAAETNNANLARYLLARGADVSTKDGDGFTPLHYASQLNNNQEIMKVLSDHDSHVKSSIDISASSQAFSGEMQQYIDSFTTVVSFREALTCIALPDDRIYASLSLYVDDLSHQLMNIPVMLHERVYDLATLLDILQKDGVDPFTKTRFSKNDIKPARAVLSQMNQLINKLLNDRFYMVAKELTPDQASKWLEALLGNKDKFDKMMRKNADFIKAYELPDALLNRLIDFVCNDTKIFDRLIPSTDELIATLMKFPAAQGARLMEFIFNDKRKYHKVINNYENIRKLSQAFPQYADRLIGNVLSDPDEYKRCIKNDEEAIQISIDFPHYFADFNWTVAYQKYKKKYYDYDGLQNHINWGTTYEMVKDRYDNKQRNLAYVGTAASVLGQGKRDKNNQFHLFPKDLLIKIATMTADENVLSIREALNKANRSYQHPRTLAEHVQINQDNSQTDSRSSLRSRYHQDYIYNAINDEIHAISFAKAQKADYIIALRQYIEDLKSSAATGDVQTSTKISTANKLLELLNGAPRDKVLFNTDERNALLSGELLRLQEQYMSEADLLKRYIDIRSLEKKRSFQHPIYTEALKLSAARKRVDELRGNQVHFTFFERRAFKQGRLGDIENSYKNNILKRRS